ncbi:MAG: FHA domain-containing protein [Ilumatobacteraceae bacterium]
MERGPPPRHRRPAHRPQRRTRDAPRIHQPQGAQGQGGRVARLVIIEPKHRRGQAFALDHEITLGRNNTCTVPIDNDAFVSGLHARVFDMDGQPMVEDLSSTNGSFLNGTRLNGMKLLHTGDRVQVGYTVLEAQ